LSSNIFLTTVQEKQNFNLFVDIVLSQRENDLIDKNSITDVFVNALVLQM